MVFRKLACIAGVSIFAAVGASSLAWSKPPNVSCKCRHAGKFYAAGDYACIKTNKGFRLAQCALSENVSSWRFTTGGCRGLSWLDKPRNAQAAALITRSCLKH